MFEGTVLEQQSLAVTASGLLLLPAKMNEESGRVRVEGGTELLLWERKSIRINIIHKKMNSRDAALIHLARSSMHCVVDFSTFVLKHMVNTYC